MTRPLATVIVPTIGRDTLTRTLQAIRCQAPARECEVLVVGDTHAGTFTEALRPVPRLCRHYGARYVAWDGGQHMVGQPQRNHGMTLARGRWLLFGQDDGAWTAGAWGAMCGTLERAPRVPHLFRVQTWQAGVVWRNRRLELGNCDADGMAFPNDPARLGQFQARYEGDWDMLRDTVALYGGQLVWGDAVIAAGRHWADVLGAA